MAGTKRWQVSHTKAVNKLIEQKLITIDAANWVEVVAKSTDPDIEILKGFSPDKLTVNIKKIFDANSSNKFSQFLNSSLRQ